MAFAVPFAKASALVVDQVESFPRGALRKLLRCPSRRPAISLLKLPKLCKKLCRRLQHGAPLLQTSHLLNQKVQGLRLCLFKESTVLRIESQSFKLGSIPSGVLLAPTCNREMCSGRPERPPSSLGFRVHYSDEHNRHPLHRRHYHPPLIPSSYDVVMY